MQCIIRDLKEMIYVVLKHHCHFKCVKSNELKKDKKMAIRPNPYKLICPKCGYSKVVSLICQHFIGQKIYNLTNHFQT